MARGTAKQPSRPWRLRHSPRSSPRPKTLAPSQLWSTQPSKWHGKTPRQNRTGGGWNASSKPPPRHHAVGGHNGKYTRPRSRGSYRQAPFGHITRNHNSDDNSGRSTSSRPVSRASARDAAEVSALPDNPMDPTQTPEPQDSQLSKQDHAPQRAPPASTKEPKQIFKRPEHARGKRQGKTTTREPGQSVIIRRPSSPFTPYHLRSSEERQKIALVKLRSLYDGRSRFHDIYQNWDVNRDGGIDVTEFQTQLHHHGFDWLTDEDVDGLFHRFIPDDKHRLDFKAFREFLFQHAIKDTTWNSDFSPFKSDEYAGWKSPRLKRQRQRRKVGQPNPWRRLSGRLDEDPSAEKGSPRSSALPPPHTRPPTRLEYEPSVRLPASLEDVLFEHGNKLMNEIKRLNGGRRPVERRNLEDVLTNLRARSKIPLHDNDLNTICSYLDLSNNKRNAASGRSQPFHHVIGRIRQAQRDAAMRHRWEKQREFHNRAVQRFKGFCRPGTAHVHYGTQGNASLTEMRKLFSDRMADGTPSPRSSRPSTAASRLSHLSSGSARQQKKSTTWGRL